MQFLYIPNTMIQLYITDLWYYKSWMYLIFGLFKITLICWYTKINIYRQCLYSYLWHMYPHPNIFSNHTLPTTGRVIFNTVARAFNVLISAGGVQVHQVHHTLCPFVLTWPNLRVGRHAVTLLCHLHILAKRILSQLPIYLNINIFFY